MTTAGLSVRAQSLDVMKESGAGDSGQEIRENEERLAGIIASAMDAIISIDADERITVFNEAAERMFRCTAEDMLGQRIDRLIPARFHHAHSHHVKKFGETHVTRRSMGGLGSISGLRSNGEEFPIEASISQVEVDGQKIFTVILRDITERKKAEEIYNRFAAIIESTEDAIISKGLDGKIQSWNPGAERLFGYSVREAIGQPIQILFPKNEYQKESDILTRIGRGERIPAFETVRLHKNGSPIPVSISISPIKDGTGKVIGASTIIRDISEQKRAEEQTREQAALLDKAQDAILVRNLQGKILFWNKGAERMYGWTKEEAMGKQISKLLYSDPKKFDEPNALTRKKGEWSGQLQHLTKDGRELTIEARWSLLRDQEGKPKSVLAINTNITEKKLIEAQFMRAQRMESIGTLAGGIAHDLNNILAPIMLSIDLLKTRMKDPGTQKILDTIDISAKRGADMVRQVVSFARGMEGCRMEVQPKFLLKDLEQIIKDTFPKGMRLQIHFPEDVWTIMADPTQVHQVLLNLCVNARDAMSSGGLLNVSVENCMLDEQYVAMNPMAKVGPHIAISVMDTGTGIPPEVIDKIFDPFFTTKAVGKGTGLGLSTAVAIVKSHDGFINVYTEPGRGTTFKVYLPAESGKKKKSSKQRMPSLPRGHGETILVVDDEPSVVSVTQQTLQAFGYRVLTAGDGAEAVALYAQHVKTVDVVLTDMMMPVMDGPSTIYALMRINPSVKIIAASGLNANGSVAKASGAGVKHFLSKPYTAETLLQILREVLKKSN